MSDKQSEGELEVKAESKPASARYEPLSNKVVEDLLEKDFDQKDLHNKLGMIKDLNNQKNLGEHIKKVFSVLIDSYPNDALDKLEEVSSMVKKEGEMSGTSSKCILDAFLEKWSRVLKYLTLFSFLPKGYRNYKASA